VSKTTTYSDAIREAFDYLLKSYPEVFIIGQGVWSPWYVGNSMNNLEAEYGKERVIDTPTSESAITGLAVGASLCGKKPIVVHPRIDFALYAMDSIVNQAAKWSSMFGAQDSPGFTARMIINRGGEQGAQHSQALHSWFAHIPGLRVVMPSSPRDARDLLIASVLSNDPVIYIDDRWLYDESEALEPIKEFTLDNFKPSVEVQGNDITIVASGYSTLISKKALKKLSERNIFPEIIDLKVLSNINITSIITSVSKTKRLLCVDGGWSECGISAEVIAKVCENIDVKALKNSPKRITLPRAPAPSSKILENIYYPNEIDIINKCIDMIK
tara:strand:- start:1096 stop:2079 length:984 start_codon:yes stop_codon:yes gene_type:complete